MYYSTHFNKSQTLQTLLMDCLHQGPDQRPEVRLYIYVGMNLEFLNVTLSHYNNLKVFV
jgi:hypothetical protein